MLKDIRNFLNGSVYGITLIIPGVSATLFAIILKFYDELIKTVNHFSKNCRKNARYLGVFLLGIAVGTVLFSSLIVFLLENFSFPTMLFFTGLLAGIVPLIAVKAKGSTPWIAPRKIVLAMVSLIALFLLAGAGGTTAVSPADAIGAMNASLALLVFLAGIINGATLVIPGLSGAFILLIMGLYPLIIYSVSYIAYFLVIGDVSLLRNSAMVLLPFGAGAAIGFLAMARLMEKLLRDFHDAVYAAILGLLVGSAILLLRDQLASKGDTPPLFLAAGALTFCAGYAMSYILGKRE